MPRSALSRIGRPRSTSTQTADTAAPKAGERDGVTYGETVTLGPDAAEAKATKATKAETKA